MALNASGSISLGGCCAGTSINKALGLSGTAQIGLGCSNVRTLAGIPCGAITMPNNFWGQGFSKGMFYGGGTSSSSLVNTVTRINACNAQVGSCTSAGTARGAMGGAGVGAFGLYFGGVKAASCTVSTGTKINSCGALVTEITSVSGTTARSALAGARISTYGVFYAGGISNLVDRLNSCLALVGSQTSAGTARNSPMGASVGCYGLYNGGCIPYVGQKIITRINSCGALVGSEGSAGYVKSIGAGAKVGTYALIYNGIECNAYASNVQRFNACGSLVGTNTSVGTGRACLGGGAASSSRGVFYGGRSLAGKVTTLYNKSTVINSCGALVGSEVAIGTAKDIGAGAGI